MEFSVSDGEWITIEAVKGCQEKIAICDKVKRKIKVEKEERACIYLHSSAVTDINGKLSPT